jgi:hypothetical protein
VSQSGGFDLPCTCAASFFQRIILKCSVVQVKWPFVIAYHIYELLDAASNLFKTVHVCTYSAECSD